MTITVNGRRIDAVAQVTKQGFTYVFDRVTGKPVWPIVERPVPTDSDVPGEKPYPTQPFPSKPPAFVDQGVSLDDANDLTPEIKAMAQEQMRKFRIGPLYTPPSLGGTLQRPGTGRRRELGRRGIRPGDRLSDRPRATRTVGVNRDRQERRIGSARRRSVFEPIRAAAAKTCQLDGLPLTSPPYAVLTAVDLNRGEIAWKVPLGRRRPGAAEPSAAERRQRCRIAWGRRTIAAARWSPGAASCSSAAATAISMRSRRRPAGKCGARRSRTRIRRTR